MQTKRYDPVYEISNNVVCATSKASDQEAALARSSLHLSKCQIVGNLMLRLISYFNLLSLSKSILIYCSGLID